MGCPTVADCSSFFHFCTGAPAPCLQISYVSALKGTWRDLRSSISQILHPCSYSSTTDCTCTTSWHTACISLALRSCPQVSWLPLGSPASLSRHPPRVVHCFATPLARDLVSVSYCLIHRIVSPCPLTVLNSADSGVSGPPCRMFASTGMSCCSCCSKIS